MTFTSYLTSLPKRINKALFSKEPFKEVMGSELFYQLTYMSAVSASGISRTRIFQMASDLPLIPAAYFARIHLLAQRLGYDYAKACNTVGLHVKSETMVSLLLRFGTALSSGQPEQDFLSEEAEVTGKLYEKEYEKDLASLTKWTDAYAAVTVSSTLIVIINMTSSMIYSMGITMLIGLVLTAIVTAGLTGWILSRAAPKESIDLFTEDGPWAQRMALKLRYYLPAGALLVCAPLGLLGVPLGWILLLGAVIILPLGLISMMAGRDIDRKDREFGPFLRSLGTMAVSTGTTITESLTRIDLSSSPALEKDLARLRHRLAAAIEPELCWQKFAKETGSKLIGETVKVFNDAVRLGGDPDVVAFLAADYASRTIALRAKRKVTASTFTWLTVVMHAAVSSLLILIFEILRNFADLMMTATSGLDDGAIQSSVLSVPIFSTPQVEFFRLMTITMILSLIVINGFSIGATDGGHKLKITFFVAIMLMISGVGLLILPPVVEGIL